MINFLFRYKKIYFNSFFGLSSAEIISLLKFSFILLSLVFSLLISPSVFWSLSLFSLIIISSLENSFSLDMSKTLDYFTFEEKKKMRIRKEPCC